MELTILSTTAGTEQIRSGDDDDFLVWKDKSLFIKNIVFNNSTHPIEIRFQDPFPDIAFLADHYLLKRRFKIEAHHSAGRIRGQCKVEKTCEQNSGLVIPDDCLCDVLLSKQKTLITFRAFYEVCL